MSAPGRYCLTRCYCTACPQYAQQHAAAALLREQEYGQRLAREGQRIARAHERRRAAAA